MIRSCLGGGGGGGGGGGPFFMCFHHAFCQLSDDMLPYFGKRKQVTKVKFLEKEQTVSVISTDVNGIS